MSLQLSTLTTIAAKELRDRLRNRWVIAVAAVFTAFALVIAYFGSAQQGAVGFRGVEVTIASLVSLAIYLIPLIALLLGFDAIVGERERGSLDLLLSMPLTRLELVLGKYLGLAAALAASTVGGFGAAGVLLMWNAPDGALYHYLGFMLSAVLLGLAFLSLSLLVSVRASERARASGLTIALWFFFVLVFDLLLLGLLVIAGDGPAGVVLPWLMLLNPADVFRVLNLFGNEQVSGLLGLASLLPELLSNPLVLAGVMLGWITAPLALAVWSFE